MKDRHCSSQIAEEQLSISCNDRIINYGHGQQSMDNILRERRLLALTCDMRHESCMDHQSHHSQRWSGRSGLRERTRLTENKLKENSQQSSKNMRLTWQEAKQLTEQNGVDGGPMHDG